LFAANGVTDHVHLLARLRQDKAVSEVLRSIKANSSAWIHEAFPELGGFHWQDGYGAFTVSQSQTGTVLHCQSASPPPQAYVSRRISDPAPGTWDRARRAVPLEMKGKVFTEVKWAQGFAHAPPWATGPSPPTGASVHTPGRRRPAGTAPQQVDWNKSDG
jgi:transposase IS200 family protein